MKFDVIVDHLDVFIPAQPVKKQNDFIFRQLQTK